MTTSAEWNAEHARARREKRSGIWPDALLSIRKARPDIWPPDAEEELATPAPSAVERLKRYIANL